jgi:hypothetical protein
MNGRALILTAVVLSACDPFRVRITEVAFPKELTSSQAFATVADVVKTVASANQLRAKECTSTEVQCLAFDGAVYLEAYGAGDHVRIRLVETSIVSPAESIESQITALLKERANGQFSTVRVR